ncbi:MAG: hypothetical protein LBG45_12355 [Dysgonamonadaceae bacterium]|jgi:hypothetical protein|nr:hypothetical protein [Dysgonamonadaceae bacterium]
MMKRIIIFIMFTALSLGLYAGDDSVDTEVNEQDTTTLPPCGLKTAFHGEFATEAVILKKEPEGDFFSPYIRYSSGKIYLIQQMENVRIIRRICNYPQYALDWDVPEKGLPVILKGKSYDYDGIQPHDLRIFYDLELLTIKKTNDPGSGRQSVFQRTGELAGNWQVKSLNLSGELANISSLPKNPHLNEHYSDISIQIPNTITGPIKITGHTFRNHIGVDLEIKGNQQISFQNYGGTRLADDERGMAFRSNIWRTVKFKIIDHNELILMDSQDKPTIVFIRQ